MIELHAAHTRTRPVAIAPLTLRFEAGIHALLGGTWDGVSTVLAICAGRLPLRSGARRALGGSDDDPEVRAGVAYVPLDAALPEPMRVDEVLRMATTLRGERARDSAVRLDTLGLRPLLTRPVRSLSREEKRAVALAEAVTSDARVILVDEPLAQIDPRAAALASEALRARARAGACVVFATGSVRDARTLGDEILTFDRGALVRRAPALDRLVLAGPRGAVIRVVASDTKLLAASLAGDEAAREVSFEADVLIARGADAIALAAALARAALRANVILESLVPDLLHDAELRAAVAGDAAGAFRAAFERAHGAAHLALAPAPAAPAASTRRTNGTPS